MKVKTTISLTAGMLDAAVREYVLQKTGRRILDSFSFYDSNACLVNADEVYGVIEVGEDMRPKPTLGKQVKTYLLDAGDDFDDTDSLRPKPTLDKQTKCHLGNEIDELPALGAEIMTGRDSDSFL